MAGGLLLMGVLALFLSVPIAFVTHGILQTVANGWRAFLHRRHIVWPIIGWYALSSLLAGALVVMVSFVPSKPVLFISLGLVAMLIWLPQNLLQLDARKPLHAFVSGFSVTLVNLTAGVAGPLLDIFFVRTDLDRHQIVATKAATQVFSHCAKIIVYGGITLGLTDAQALPWWFFATAVPLSMAGTVVGGQVLDRISDVDFKRWTAWIVTGIGLMYFLRGIRMLP